MKVKIQKKIEKTFKERVLHTLTHKELLKGATMHSKNHPNFKFFQHSFDGKLRCKNQKCKKEKGREEFFKYGEYLDDVQFPTV